MPTEVHFSSPLCRAQDTLSVGKDVFFRFCAPQKDQSSSTADWRPPKSGDQEGDGRPGYPKKSRRPSKMATEGCGGVSWLSSSIRGQRSAILVTLAAWPTRSRASFTLCRISPGLSTAVGGHLFVWVRKLTKVADWGFRSPYPRMADCWRFLALAGSGRHHCVLTILRLFVVVECALESDAVSTRTSYATFRRFMRLLHDR